MSGTNKSRSPIKRSQTNQNDSITKDSNYERVDLRGLNERDVEIEHLKTTVIALSEKVEIIRDMEQDVANAQMISKDSESKRVELQVHIKQTSVKIQETAVENKSFQDSVINENKNLQAECQRLREAVVQKEKQLIDTVNRLEREKMDIKSQLEKEKMDQMLRYETQLTERDTKIKSKINSIQITLLLVYYETILQLQAKVLEQEQIIRLNADIADQLKIQLNLNAQQDLQKKKLQKELETASDYILALEDKVYKANKTSLELLRQLKDAEIEIETLKNYIIELKQRIAVYIPVKDDVIDRKLAEFINNYPDRQKLKIMFMRESDGVYQFGTKRVAVRVDKDKINIRVGGGYLSIDEFLDQYTPAELEKMERKDPLKKFSEKIAIQKTLVGKELRESSPIRGSSPSGSPTRSPNRR